MKNFNSVFPCKQMLLVGILLISTKYYSWGQNGPLPDDHPISKAAPHLPEVLKFNGNANGLKYSVYLSPQEEDSIREWATTYPEEVRTYKSAISAFIENSDISSLSESDKILYADLQAQLPKISSYCTDDGASQ